MDEIIQLPPLRNDITLLPSSQSLDQTPTWQIYDPLRHKYFQIDQLSFEILARWKIGNSFEVLKALKNETSFVAVSDDIFKLVDFLGNNFLLDQVGSSVAESLYKKFTAHKSNWKVNLLKSYLYFKIPLIKPQAFLDVISPFTRIFFSPLYIVILVTLTIIGCYLISRQSELFFSTFTAYGTLEGQVALLIAVIVSKILHEFGHGIALRYYGGRIPIMGIALLVMFPVFYTDTGDAWRLMDRRKRLIVGASGIIAEVSLAVIALFLWSFAPEGVFKSCLFVLSTTVWVGTIIVNASPFMRFDGYYILSDYLDFPNLQDRAFAMARWRLREFFFNFNFHPPENLKKSKLTGILIYAYTTWIYRFLLFLSIAVLIYYFFFKLLGIILFLIEIWFFILRPITTEFFFWWSERKRMKLGKTNLVLLLSLILLAIGVLYPWQSSITAPAVLDASAVTKLYAPSPGIIERVLANSGESVLLGQPLYRLKSPSLFDKKIELDREMELIQLQLYQAAVDPKKLRYLNTLKTKLLSLKTELALTNEQISLHNIVSTSNGQLIDVPHYIRPGLWINTKEFWGLIISTSGSTLTAFVTEDDLSLIEVGANIRYVPETSPHTSFFGILHEIAPIAINHVDEDILSSVYSGKINVRSHETGIYRPVEAIYQIKSKFPHISTAKRSRGTIYIDSIPKSIFETIFKSFMLILIQESKI